MDKTQHMPGTPRRVWVISELYYPEDVSTGFFLTRIAEGLAQHCPVSVLCSQPTYAARGTRAPDVETRKGVRIRRCASTTFNKDVLAFRLINLLTISLSIFRHALFGIKRGERVIVVTNPPLMPFLVAAACKLKRAECLLLVHDVYPEVLVAAGMSRPGSLLTRLVSWVNRLLYHNVRRTIVLGRDMQALVATKISRHGDPPVIIPNFADSIAVSPQPRDQNALLAELGLEDKFVLQYSGNMGRTHGLEDLLACARELQADERFVFLFIGSGARKYLLEEAINTEGLANIRLLRRRPLNELEGALNACDVGVISLLPGMSGVSVPSRMYNILAAGKPILAVTDAVSELAQVVREEQVGWVVEPGRPDLLAAAVREAAADAQLLKDMSQRARQAVDEKYSLPRIVAAYRDLLRDLDEESHS